MGIQARTQVRSQGILVRIIAAGLVVSSAGGAAQSTTPDVEAQARLQAQLQAQQNAITDRYLTEVQVVMVGRVDSGKAAAGQEVVAKTLADARLADGTALPRGTRLLGRVIQVKAGGQEQGSAVLTLTFDRAEAKPGQMVSVRSVIRTVAKDSAKASRDVMAAMPPMIMSTGVGPGGFPTRRGGVAGGMPGTTVPAIGGVGGGPGSTMPLPGTTGGRMPESGPGTGSTLPSATDPTIGGRAADMTPLNEVASSASPDRRVARAGESLKGAPRATGLDGVLLWATPSASGTLTAMGKNIALEAGTPMTMGLITR